MDDLPVRPPHRGRGHGHIATALRADGRAAISRDDAALAIAEGLAADHLVRQIVTAVEGDRPVRDALAAISRARCRRPRQPPTGNLGAARRAQSDNPPTTPDMIASDASPLDADVEW